MASDRSSWCQQYGYDSNSEFRNALFLIDLFWFKKHSMYRTSHNAVLCGNRRFSKWVLFFCIGVCSQHLQTCVLHDRRLFCYLQHFYRFHVLHYTVKTTWDLRSYEYAFPGSGNCANPLFGFSWHCSSSNIKFRKCVSVASRVLYAALLRCSQATKLWIH